MNPARTASTILLAALVCALGSCGPRVRVEPPPGPMDSWMTHLLPRAAASLPRIGGKANMNLAISLAPFPNAIPRPMWIQLLDSNDGLLLLSSSVLRGNESGVYGNQSTVYATPFRADGKPNQVLIHNQFMPDNGRWDAAVRPDGGIVALFELSTGASMEAVIEGVREDGNPLAMRMSAGGRRWLTPESRRGQVVSKPRFARGLRGRLMVTAMLWEARPEVFTNLTLREGPDDASPSRVIGIPAVAATLVAVGEELVLVYLTPPIYRESQRGHDQGPLCGVRLDAAFSPISPCLELFPGTKVGDFDATALEGGLAVAATTDAGVSVAIAGHGPGGFEVLGRKDEAVSGKVWSPSIVGAAGKLHLGVLVSQQDEVGAHVLTGVVELGP